MELMIRENHRNHVLSSTALLLGMAGVLGLTGYLILGAVGMIMAASIGVGLSIFGPRISTRMIMRIAGAQPLHPSKAPGLYQIMAQLAQKAGLPNAPELYFQPTGALNAFAAGHRNQSAVAISAGLIHNLTERQIRGVLAHEISHIQNNDVAVMSTAAQFRLLTENLSFMGKVLLLLSLPAYLLGGYTIPWAALVLLVVSPWLSLVLQMALSQTREYNADLNAVRLTGDYEGLASALLKLENQRCGLMERILKRRIPEGPEWLRTHPSTEERVRRLRALGEVQEPRPVHQHRREQEAEAVVIPARRTGTRRVRFIPVSKHRPVAQKRTHHDDHMDMAG